ncbi:MAG: hypothetical protein E6Q64_05725 [Ottowia sp.]|nr:MAG: hypothetical protein E6Q64_05725 [Ottowia sp.]
MLPLDALQYGFAPALATALLHALWQDALLALGAACVLAILARAGAALRHNVAMLFLLAMVAVPAWTFAGFWRLPPEAINAGLLPAITSPQLDAAHGVFAQDSNPAASVLALLWLMGVGGMLIHRFGGWRVLVALERRTYQPLSDDWLQRVEALRRGLGIARRVAVRFSADVLTPFTARLIRPVVWLPLSLLAQLPRAQVEALLAHELAHVARMDWLWNGVQCVVEALLFFHPAAWWLGRRIRIEREHACDDRAVAVCGDAIALADALVHLERQRSPMPRLVLAAQGGSLMNRITRLLADASPRSRWTTRIGAMVVLAAGTLVITQLAFGSVRPSVRINATTDGVLGPNDSREIIANGIDRKRYYRIDVDAQGRATEVYREDGADKPVDDGVHRWVASMLYLSTPPMPPAPPPPPVFDALPLPPAPPSPPEPPSITDSAEFKALLRRVVAQPGLEARLGSPITLVSRDIRGEISLRSNHGDANVQLELRGSKGQATVHVDARMQRGTWAMNKVEVVQGVR